MKNNKLRISKCFLKAANSLINLLVILCLLTAGAYAVYALWDNRQIYAAAEDVQADMLKLKPEAGDAASFEELLSLNPDVCAWLTLDNTSIDYPVLQGSTNLDYINHDVYGSFSLAGSIFLDSRNKRDFSDSYSLIYGHHMEKHEMFGDLDSYKDETFFEKNKTGMLLLPTGAYKLEILACLVANAGEKLIFEPGQQQDLTTEFVSYARNNSLHLHEETIQKLEQMESPKILALSTCSSEFTDARTVILTVMEPCQAADQEEK
jgi:sortase B